MILRGGNYKISNTNFFLVNKNQNFKVRCMVNLESVFTIFVLVKGFTNFFFFFGQKVLPIPKEQKASLLMGSTTWFKIQWAEAFAFPLGLNFCSKPVLHGPVGQDEIYSLEVKSS